jgi:glycosyltransferase involved in cell wall biosynthesis
VKPLRLAHVTATFPPYRAGTGNVCRHNARRLAQRGHDVHVFTPALPGAPRHEQDEGVKIHRLRPLLTHGHAHLLPTLLPNLRGFDLVHLHMPFYGAAGAVYLLSRLAAAPVVITHHQDVHLKGPASLLSRIHDHLLAQRLMISAGRVCFTSLDYARHCQYASLIASRQLIPAELPNGVDPARFTPGPRPDRLLRSYGLHGRPIALFVGALDRAHYFKGLEVLLEAMTLPPLSEAALVIVGQGNLRPRYQQRAARLGLGHRVHFAGPVPGDELADHYRLAGATVLPSTTAGEAFGLVLLESMACATPVVASDLPGVRTVVSPGVDGLLARPSDAGDLAARLGALLARPPEQRRAMGLAGRRKVEARYNWSRIGDRLERIYQEVLEERRTAAQHRPRLEAGR